MYMPTVWKTLTVLFHITSLVHGLRHNGTRVSDAEYSLRHVVVKDPSEEDCSDPSSQEGIIADWEFLHRF